MTPAAFFASGQAVDLVLAVLAAEFAWLTFRPSHGGRRRGAAAADAALALGPGACILMALRAALTEGGWPWIAVWLAASFPIHLADLARRRR